MSEQNITGYTNHWSGAEIAAQRIVIAALQSSAIKLPSVASEEDAKLVGEMLGTITATLAKKLFTTKTA